MRLVIPLSVLCVFSTNSALAQGPPSLGNVGNPPNSAQSGVIDGSLAELASLVDCWESSSACEECEDLEFGSDYFNSYLALLSLMQENFEIFIGENPLDGMTTSPDWCSDGAWQPQPITGTDSWTPDSNNRIRIDPDTFGEFTSGAKGAIIGAMLMHETDHFDDGYYDFINGNPAPSTLCVYLQSEIAAAQWELWILRCFACCFDWDDEALSEIDERISVMEAFKEQKEWEAENANC